MTDGKSIPEHVDIIRTTVNLLQESIKDDSQDNVKKMETCAARLANEVEELSKFPSTELAQFPDAIIGLSASLSSLVDNLNKAKGETKERINKILHQIKAQKGYNK